MSRKDIELLACGSRSTRRVFLPLLARAAARLMAVVVLPTPPFWLVMAMIIDGGQSKERPPSGQAIQTAMSARRHRG